MKQAQISISCDDPYREVISQFVRAELPGHFVSTQSELVDQLTEAIVATGTTRFGARNSPESQVAIRDIIRYWTALDRPIPFLVPWGSEKPNGSGVDIAELMGLKTLISLDERIRAHYSPGSYINIRIEDASAPHLFTERAEQARKDAALYSKGFMNLIHLLNKDNVFTAKPESAKVTEQQFNDEANRYWPVLFDHIMFPLDPTYTARLKTISWDKPLADDTKAFYMSRYEKLYPELDKTEHKRIMARYFGGALARKKLGLNGDNDTWGGKFLEVSFTSAVPGIAPDRSLRRVQYRTIPSSITNLHMPAWRAKGYMKILNDNHAKPGIIAFSEPMPYNPLAITLHSEETGITQDIQADYIIQS